MTKKDISIWVRIFDYSGGGGIDVEFQPLMYNSFSDWVKHWTGVMEAHDMADFIYVDWDFVQNESPAASLVSDEGEWNGWNEYFDMIRSYGVDAFKFLDAAMGIYTGDMADFPSWVEENYRGEYDKFIDYAYALLDDVGIDEKLAEDYFDYDGFGLALKANGDLSAIIMDDWEDRYDTEAEAQAVYDEMYDMRNAELAEWYIYDLVGDLKSALGDQMKTFFDYQKFARDLEYDYYYEGGFVFTNY